MSLIKIALEKEAGLWDGLGKGLWAAGKTLTSNNTIRNAAIGTGIGAVAGAATAQDSQRLSGALKGGLIGGATGGLATSGMNIYKNMKPGIGPGVTFTGALRNEGQSILNAAKNSKSMFQNVKAVASGNASAWVPGVKGPQNQNQQ